MSKDIIELSKLLYYVCMYAIVFDPKCVLTGYLHAPQIPSKVLIIKSEEFKKKWC